MPGEFGMTVELNPRPSMRALRMAFALHLTCLGLLLAAQPPAAWLLTLAAGFGASWLWTRRHPAFGMGARAWTRWIWHADGSWTLQRDNGTRCEGQLRSDAIVSGPWLVLRIRLHDGRTATRVLLGDELSGETMRRLRARLSDRPAAGEESERGGPRPD